MTGCSADSDMQRVHIFNWVKSMDSRKKLSKCLYKYNIINFEVKYKQITNMPHTCFGTSHKHTINILTLTPVAIETQEYGQTLQQCNIRHWNHSVWRLLH